MSAQEETAGSTVAYLHTNWLDNGATTVDVSSCLTYTYPYYHSTWYTSPKIRLTLSDVEHMRACAAKDKKLKAALKKVAPYIEVEIDFP